MRVPPRTQPAIPVLVRKPPSPAGYYPPTRSTRRRRNRRARIPDREIRPRVAAPRGYLLFEIGAREDLGRQCSGKPSQGIMAPAMDTEGYERLREARGQAPNPAPLRRRRMRTRRDCSHRINEMRQNNPARQHLSHRPARQEAPCQPERYHRRAHNRPCTVHSTPPLQPLSTSRRNTNTQQHQAPTPTPTPTSTTKAPTPPQTPHTHPPPSKTKPKPARPPQPAASLWYPPPSSSSSGNDDAHPTLQPQPGTVPDQSLQMVIMTPSPRPVPTPMEGSWLAQTKMVIMVTSAGSWLG